MDIQPTFPHLVVLETFSGGYGLKQLRLSCNQTWKKLQPAQLPVEGNFQDLGKFGDFLSFPLGKFLIFSLANLFISPFGEFLISPFGEIPNFPHLGILSFNYLGKFLKKCCCLCDCYKKK